MKMFSLNHTNFYQWHLGFYAKEFTPTQRGFDTFYGYYGGQADYWDHSLESNGFWGLDLHKDTPDSSEVSLCIVREH